MIQVNNLDKAYGRQVLFDKVSFTINAGERVGLVGRNGHGKTTLFRLILGREQPDSGTISFPGGYSMGHLSQHIHFSRNTVLEEGCLALKPSEGGRDESYKVETILSGLGFTRDDFNRSPSALSGGYQVRLNLAKALISVPNLLLLDEPTNYLDITSVRWLTKFLLGWKNELIIITHDRAFMDGVTTHTMGIHRCKIKKIAGTTEKLYQQIIEEEQFFERTRINDDKKRREVEEFINRFRVQANKAKAVQSRIKALQKKEKLERLSDIKNLDFSFKSVPFMGKFLLSAEDLSFSFNGGPQLFENVGFSVGKRDRIAIIGKNGRGKTTLLNLLSGELSPVKGTITRHTDTRIAYFGQTNIERLNPQNTVENEILGVHPDSNRRAARTICGIMMFDGDKALKKVSVLSGGEKSRVLLGKLLVSPANLLLLDEPTNHLDMESIDSLIEAIDAFEGAVCIVTHSEMVLHAVADRLIIFDGGAVSLFDGSYQDFLDRVGWKGEEPAAKEAKSVATNRLGSKRDLRRVRAEILSERSRVVGTLQKKIFVAEQEIMKLEDEMERDNTGLLDASRKGDGETIKKLSRAIAESKDRIDVLFNELEKMTEEHDRLSREFEQKLSEID